VTAYTFARHRSSPEPERVDVAHHPTDAAAQADARAALILWGVTVDDRPLSIAVARGEGEAVAWLGAWDLQDQAPEWSPAPD